VAEAEAVVLAVEVAAGLLMVLAVAQVAQAVELFMVGYEQQLLAQ